MNSILWKTNKFKQIIKNSSIDFRGLEISKWKSQKSNLCSRLSILWIMSELGNPPTNSTISRSTQQSPNNSTISRPTRHSLYQFNNINPPTNSTISRPTRQSLYQFNNLNPPTNSTISQPTRQSQSPDELDNLRITQQSPDQLDNLTSLDQLDNLPIKMSGQFKLWSITDLPRVYAKRKLNKPTNK